MRGRGHYKGRRWSLPVLSSLQSHAPPNRVLWKAPRAPNATAAAARQAAAAVVAVAPGQAERAAALAPPPAAAAAADPAAAAAPARAAAVPAAAAATAPPPTAAAAAAGKRTPGGTPPRRRARQGRGWTEGRAAAGRAAADAGLGRGRGCSLGAPPPSLAAGRARRRPRRSRPQRMRRGGSPHRRAASLAGRAARAAAPSGPPRRRALLWTGPGQVSDMSLTPSPSPSSSLLSSSRGVARRHRPSRDAKGCTLSDVPITMSASAAGKSASAASKKRAGSCSPKKTMSGLQSPPYRSASSAQPPGPSRPTATARRTSPSGTVSPVSMQWQPSKLPCAAMVKSAGSPARASSESMFCVKQRRSSPLVCSSATKWCAGVGWKLSGHISLARR
mmetsp:Transcript_43691/g.144661  ORF Transcript_43691/g.144661 Transcript_43691/m.144661 type:complete len:389 (+) Transcript_43691:87-1253(+)